MFYTGIFDGYNYDVGYILNRMIDRLTDMSGTEVQLESCCGNVKGAVSRVKRQMLLLILETDIEECLNEWGRIE